MTKSVSKVQSLPDGEAGSSPEDYANLVRALLDHSLAAIAVYAADRPLVSNDAFAALAGLGSAAEFTARHEASFAELVRREDSQAVSTALDEVLEGRKEEARFDTAIPALDSRLTWVDCKLRAFDFRGQRRILVSAQKIVGREMAQFASLAQGASETEALSDQTEERFRRLVDMMPYGITWTDLQGVTRFANPAYNCMLGYEPGELTNSTVWELLPEDQRPPQEDFFSSLIHEMPTPLPNITQCRTKSGGTIDVLFDWIYDRDANGDITGFISVMTDVTEPLRVEAQLRHAKEAAERANREKSRFLAAASHDLQQPLNSLSILLGSLSRPCAESKKAEVVTVMSRALEGAMALLRSVLDISKLEAGVIMPRLENFELQDCFDQIEAELGPQVDDSAVKFRLVKTSAVIRSDRMLLKSILHNLVSNALRYTKQGKVLVGCRHVGSKVRIEVWDTGRGIPNEKQKVIFEEFKRLEEPEGDNQVYSLGLGLSIVERTCQLLGFGIHLESTVGKGSLFSFEVPLAPDQAKSKAGKSRGGRTGTQVLAGRKILLIEDDAVTLAHTKMLLDSWGGQCSVAESMSQGLKEAAVEAPELILADYHLDDTTTGVMAATRIRQMLGDDIPVIIVTSSLTSLVLADILNAGFSFLEKPISPARLRALLTHYLSEE